MPARCEIVKIATRATTKVQHISSWRKKFVESCGQLKTVVLVFVSVASRVVAVCVDRDEYRV
jgi:hypothetical protein